MTITDLMSFIGFTIVVIDKSIAIWKYLQHKK